MIKNRLFKQWLIILGLFSQSFLLHAETQPKFILTPLTATTVSVLPNGVANIKYQVTNQTKVTRTLTMVPITGIAQETSGPGFCSNPFTLAAHQSCILSLNIYGSQIADEIFYGPQICKTKGSGNNAADPFLCSQPSHVNRLKISRLVPLSFSPASMLLTANGSPESFNITNNSKTQTALNIAVDLTGTALEGAILQDSSNCKSLPPLQSCTLTITPLLTAVPPTSVTIKGTNTITLTASIGVRLPLAYMANTNGNSITSCIIDADNALLRDCKVILTGTTFPRGLVFNPAATFAYIVNDIANTVTRCEINATNGDLDNCVDAGATGLSTPKGIALNAAGTRAYIISSSGVAANRCMLCDINIANGLFSSCTPSGATGLSGAQGVALNTGGTLAYITNSTTGTVTKCTVNGGTGILSACSNFADPLILTPRVITINQANSFAYIANVSISTITKCAIDGSGNLGSCVDSGATNITNPEQLVFNTDESLAYISNFNVSSVTKCNVNATTGILSNCVDTGADNLNTPWGIVLQTFP